MTTTTTAAKTTKGKRAAADLAPGERVESRGVLAGAYRGGAERRGLLTHMVVLDATDGEVRTGCRIGLDALVDRYGMDDPHAAPTCPSCARRWARVTR